MIYQVDTVGTKSHPIWEVYGTIGFRRYENISFDDARREYFKETKVKEEVIF